MAIHVVTTTAKGMEVITGVPMYSMCKRHVAILSVAQAKPSPAIQHLFKEVRSIRGVGFTNELLVRDLVELSTKGFVKVHK